MVEDHMKEYYDQQEERMAAERADDAARGLGTMGGTALQLQSWLRQPLNLIRLAAAGLAVVGLFLLAQSFNAQGATPSAVVASPSPGASVSPGAAGAPVTGTTTANATFTKVSGPCRLATRFTDRFSFEAKDGSLTLTQLSNGHVSRGTIDRSGAFMTSAEGQGYRGTITGTTGTGQHTYTGDGCNEVYDFTMTLSSPLIAGTPVQGSGNRPPQAGPIVAVQEGTSTIYSVPDASDPEGAQLRWTWSNPHPCAPKTGNTATYTWPHPHPPCPAEPVHPAIISVTACADRRARTFAAPSEVPPVGRLLLSLAS
jgi:hypothetical protein